MCIPHMVFTLSHGGVGVGGADGKRPSYVFLVHLIGQLRTLVMLQNLLFEWKDLDWIAAVRHSCLWVFRRIRFPKLRLGHRKPVVTAILCHERSRAAMAQVKSIKACNVYVPVDQVWGVVSELWYVQRALNVPRGCAWSKGWKHAFNRTITDLSII